MALTLEVEQRLEAADVIQFFNGSADTWRAMAKDAYDYTCKGFPEGKPVRRDDVSKALAPVIEVDASYRAFRDTNKLRQKFWVSDFTDLIIDRCWDGLKNNTNGDKP